MVGKLKLADKWCLQNRDSNLSINYETAEAYLLHVIRSWQQKVGQWNSTQHSYHVSDLRPSLNVCLTVSVRNVLEKCPKWFWLLDRCQFHKIKACHFNGVLSELDISFTSTVGNTGCFISLGLMTYLLFQSLYPLPILIFMHNQENLVIA